MTQTGTQVLTGFLLAIAFQNRFTELGSFQQNLYLALVGAAVLTTAVGLVPVHLHRVLFRENRKLDIVKVAHVLVQLTLAGVGAVLVATVLLVFDVVVSRTAALTADVMMLVALIGVTALPRMLRSMRPPGPDQDEAPGQAART